MKERVTITIDGDILERLDQGIDGVNGRSRSHLVEKAVEQYLAPNIAPALNVGMIEVNSATRFEALGRKVAQLLRTEEAVHSIRIGDTELRVRAIIVNGG